jgi:hypothetical protein
MRIVKGILLILVATFVATSTLAQIHIIPQAKRDSVINPPTLKGENMHFIKGRSVDFGLINEDDGTHKRVLKWQNTGKSQLTITRITTSCGCVRCNYDRQSVGVGEYGEISVIFSPKGHPGVMHQRIFIYTNRSEQMPSAIIDINGEVKASADRSGDYPHAVGRLLLRNRTIHIDSNEDQTIRIACMNSGNSDIHPEKDALLSSPNITLWSEPKTLGAGCQGEIIISYTPTQNGDAEPLRLYIDNKNIPPRDRKIEIVTTKR